MKSITIRRAMLRASNSAFQSLESRRMLAAVSWDGGAGTSNWTDANNWSTNSLPTAADDVTINVATNPTILLAGANAVINSLATDESLNLNSGTLSLAAASSASAAATVTMGAATLSGAGTFTINGPLAFNGGTMNGSGTTIAKGTATIGSGGAYSAVSDTRTLRIDGSATLSTASGYNTTVATGARIRVGSGGTLAVGAGSDNLGAGAIIVDAGGTLTRTAAGTGTVIMQVQNSGTISAALGTTLNLNSLVSTGGVFDGAGTIQTYGGTHTFANSSTTASVTYNHIGGTIDGAGTLTTNGPFNWTAGVIQGTGTISLRGTSRLGFGGAYIQLRDTRTIRVDAGTTSLGNDSGYNLAVAGGARIAVGNGGILEANVANGATVVNGDGGNGTGAINVEAGGKLTRTVSTGSNAINIPVNNLGTIDVDVAALSLYGGGTNAAANTPAPGATLGLAGNWTYNDGTTFSGGGTVAMYTGSHTVNDGPAAATINVAGDGTTLSIDTGTFEGAGQTNVAAGGTFAFRRGVMQGTAVTTVFGTTLVGAGNGYSSIQGTHTLRVRGAGSFGLSGGYDTRIAANARLVAGAGGTLDASSTGDLQIFGVGTGNIGAVVVEPGGTFTRTAAGIEYIDLPVVNQGGTIRAATGAILAINAGSTYAAGSVFDGPGIVQLRGGTHSIDGATGVALGGSVQLYTGTLAGSSTLTVSGFIDLFSGTLAGSTTTLVNGTANVGSGSGYLTILDTHQLRVGNGGVATHNTAGGYDVRVSANARIAVANGGTYDFGANGNDMQLFGVGGVPGTGLLVIEAGGTLTRTFANPGDSIQLPVQNAGTIRAAAGAELGLLAGSTQLAGATIAGPGNVHFNGGTHTISGTTTILAGARLLHYTSTIDGAGTFIAEGRLDIANGATQTGTGVTLIRGTTSTLGAGNGYTTILGSRNIRVEGTLTTANNGGYDTRLSVDARITVASGGTFDFSGGNPDIFGVGGASGTGLFVIEAGGTLTRTAAGGDTLSLPVQNAGTIRAAAGSQLGIGAGSTQLAGATIAGPGDIYFNGGTHSIDGATSVAVGGHLLQTAGVLTGAGTLTVDGTYNFNAGSINGSGTIILRGTASTLGAGNAYTNVNETRTIRVEGTATVTTAGGYDIRFAGGTNLTVASGGTLVLGGTSELLAVGAGNVGTLTIQSGGTMQRAVAGTAPIALSVVNLGTVRIDAGAINFTGATNADDGTFLSSGRYLVFSGANLGFAPALTTLTADVELSGTASATGLGVLAVNRGRLGFVNGADGSIDPAGATRFRNEGIIDLSPTSVLTVVGGMDFGGTSQPIVRSEIASATDFGKIVVTGASLDLNSPNSTNRFDPDLVGGYDPAIGTQFAILTAPSRLNSFDSIQGGLTPSNNVIGAYSNATTYGAVIVAGPAPAAPQILSQTYEYQTRQAVVFTFDQDVSAFLSRKDYTILNLDTNQALPQSAGTLTFNPTSNTATLVLTNQMPDGDYRMTVNASDIANSVGVPASGAPITLEWFVLSGDVNRDRIVNFDDLLIIAQNYSQSGLNFTQGNVNYSSNGLVNFDDLLVLAQGYGHALLATSSPLATPAKRRGIAPDLVA